MEDSKTKIEGVIAVKKMTYANFSIEIVYKKDAVSIQCLDQINLLLFQKIFTSFDVKILFKIMDLSDFYKKIVSAIKPESFIIDQNEIGETPILELQVDILLDKKKTNIKLDRVKTENILIEFIKKREEEIKKLKKENDELKSQNNELIKKIDLENTGKISRNRQNSQRNSNYSNVSTFVFKNKNILNDKTIEIKNSQGNQFLIDLCSQNHYGLEELKLINDNITDIKPLGTMSLEKLYILDLYNNKIKDISPLKDKNLDNLKQLNLQNNYISDITPLEQLKCVNLEILRLDHNQIEDLTPLTQVKFKNLEKLTLNNNKIKDISVFRSVPFKKLKKLSLYSNNINDISVFKENIFKNLYSLWVYDNKFNYDNNKDIIGKLETSTPDFLYLHI